MWELLMGGGLKDVSELCLGSSIIFEWAKEDFVQSLGEVEDGSLKRRVLSWRNKIIFYLFCPGDEMSSICFSPSI